MRAGHARQLGIVAGGQHSCARMGYADGVHGNLFAFAALDASGAVSAWGDAARGGTGAPSGDGFASIASADHAFAALDASGAISAWGDADAGGSGAPSGSGFASIASS